MSLLWVFAEHSLKKAWIPACLNANRLSAFPLMNACVGWLVGWAGTDAMICACDLLEVMADTSEFMTMEGLMHPVEMDLYRKIEDCARLGYRGCLLGGAVGDALGAPVEFDSLATIRQRFGNKGIRNYVPAYGRAGAITDDTQMTLFTAEGLLRARMRGADTGVCPYPAVIAESYLRWYHTQNPDHSPSLGAKLDGWLLGHSALHAQRAPGLTCIRALLRMPLDGRRARNESKGCGAVMRVAPIGLFVASFLKGGDTAGAVRAFGLGVEAAAITHGHATGQLAAGVLAMLIVGLVKGVEFDRALDEACAELIRHPDHAETLTAINRARELAEAQTPSAESVESLGGGWVAEEALAISLYCARVASSFEDGIALAVNHGGDSDSTGAITGNLLGAMMGERAIPQRWLAALELREVIREVADDLLTTPNWCLEGGELDGEGAFRWRRYPG